MDLIAGLPALVKWIAHNGAQLTLSQYGDYPGDYRTIVLRSSRASTFDLRFRIPSWTSSPSITINGIPTPLTVQRGFASIKRTWHDNDRIFLKLPMPLRLEAIDTRHPDTVALLHGPMVLFNIHAECPSITRQELLSASYQPSSGLWKASSMFFNYFIALGNLSYTTYQKVT